MGLFDSLTEELRKPFYSKKEAEQENAKSFTTTAPRSEVENNYIDYDPFTSYTSHQMADQSQQNVSRRDMIGKWRRVAMYPEVDEAISEIISEAIIYDDLEETISLELGDLDVSQKIKDKMHDSFKKILFLLDFQERGEELFRQWYIDGVLNLEAVYDNKQMTEGIKKLIILSPFNIFKVKDRETGEMKYFLTKAPTYNVAADYKRATRVFLDEQITMISSGQWSIDKKTPLSYINKAMKAINQLYLLEDSVVIYKITRSPEKRVFYIDTGNLPKTKAEEYIKSLITKYRQKKIYNADTGTVENKTRAISILEDFWLPRNAAGRGTQIETLPGIGQGLEDMSAIDYFVKKVYRALQIPASRMIDGDQGSQNVNITGQLDVEKDELKFFRFVLKLRRRFNNMFIDLLKKDLIARKVMSLEDWQQIQEHIKFRYANNNEYAEIKQLQILEMRTQAAMNSLQLVEGRLMSKEKVRRDILKQNDEDYEEENKRMESEREENPEDYVDSDAADQEPPEQPEPAPQPEPDEEPEETASDIAKKKKAKREEDKKPKLVVDDIREEIGSIVREELRAALKSLKQ